MAYGLPNYGTVGYQDPYLRPQYAAAGLPSAPSLGASAYGQGGTGLYTPPELTAGAISNVASTAGSALQAIPTPWTQIAGLGLQGAGLAASVWGMYEQKKQADKAYEDAKKRYDEEMRRAREQDRIAMEQLAKQNMMTGAEYANQQRQTGREVYGAYNAQIGR